MLIFRLLKESLDFAYQAIVVNKLRTLLSLLGITVGIYAIITVYSLVDSLESGIKESVSVLGNDVIYVQKMPWAGGENFPWWKYMNRPEPTYTDYKMLKSRMPENDQIAYVTGTQENLKYMNNSVSSVGLVAATHEYEDIWNLDIDRGRYFTETESRSGTPICIIGDEIVNGLFQGESPLDKEIKFLGRKVRVVGVFKRQGKSMTGQNFDEMVLVPANFLRKLINLDVLRGGSLMAKVPHGETVDQFKDELQGQMRGIRKLSPRQEDNFSLNEMSLITGALDGLFSVLGIVGTVIGSFSILVGGFGIANIMFVSVKERTTQIGIQKSLGAKRSFILLQFLFEAIILCSIGGALGLLFVYLTVTTVSYAFEFDAFLSLSNIISGISISVVIGLVSGFMPALMASRMSPVDAIRANT